MKYSCYEYEVSEDFDGSGIKWGYIILLNDPEHKFWTGEDKIVSDEWYATEQEAIEAACNHIDILEEGPDEPDYDAPTAHETYMKAHENRQKLRGY